MITVEQYLHNQSPDPDRKGGDQIDEVYRHTRRFAVRGERFQFNPTEVYTVFPPPNNQGEYDNVLPHVVFTSRTLPWMRSPEEDPGMPWLALLLFDESDPPPQLQNIQVGDLQRKDFPRDKDAPQMSKSTLPANAVSYPWAASNLDYGEDLSDRCQAIDVRVDLFNAIVPNKDDLAWLAHVRTVSLDKKEGQQQDDTADFSVIVGNRLPAPNTTCTVHVVSLEGLIDYLPSGDNDTPAAITLPDGKPAELIRLVSLKSWSFTSVDPTQSFSGYLTHLDSGPFQRKGTLNASNEAERAVANAFKLGYTAINHHTRQGDHTVSWYRGPFVPFAVPQSIVIPIPDVSSDTQIQPIATSDALLRYDPDTGMMDVSYSSAWQLGQLLGLQNMSFALALYTWKRAVAQKTAMALEQEIIQETLGTVLALSNGIQPAAAAFITDSLKPHLVPSEPVEKKS